MRKYLSLSDFRFFPSYRSRKRGTEKKIFEAEAAGRSQKCFRGFTFSTEVTWEKRISDEDKFFQREWQGHISKQNAFFIFLVFSWHKVITKILGILFAVKYSS